MKLAKPIIINSISLLNPKSVLDLGCGKCKFSKIFADKGAAVIGVDKIPAITSIDNFKFIKGDVCNFNFNCNFDLIIGTGILHFIERQNVYKLIKKMQDNTSNNGFNFLICISDEESFSNDDYFYTNERELNWLYHNWKIIHNTLCFSKLHKEGLHQHKVIVFLAKKNEGME